jgi:signal transduction histidine kinase
LLVALMAHNARLAQQLAEEEQAHAEFIDFVAHELKQPMTAMQGYSKMLTLGIGGDLNDRQQEFVDVINANVGRMGKLVSDLLEISRLEAGRIRLNLAPVSILEVMGEVLSSASDEIESRHHTLEQAIPGSLPPVWADRERLVQILTHLVRNAYMYTPEGGQLHIAAEVLERTDRVRVGVTDTGIGLSPTDLVRLRERFFRADHELVRTQTGTGLGLSIVRGLVELHGGELSIESKPGQGSVFAFTLPLSQEPAA